MDIVLKVWGIIVTVWEYLNGHKTDMGLKLGGWLLAIMAFENATGIHPAFLEPILSFLQQVAVYLTGGGLAHKGVKAGMKLGADMKAKAEAAADPTQAPPEVK